MPAGVQAPIELIIFDCDGVLVDSETLSARVSQRVLADLGCELPLSRALEEFTGASTEVYTARVAELVGRVLEPGWDDCYRSWFTGALETELQAIPGIHECLEGLSVPTCVASNSGHDRIRRSLDVTGLLTRFDGRIFSAEDVARGKPAPDVFLWAAQSMGVAPAACVVVEDSPFGVHAARAAGMRVLGYAAATPAERLEGEQTVIFDDMADVPRLLSTL
ncbi:MULTISPECIES: HAD family hydrolase [unclassified Microbacterium]|uniref:HAD family hydrolase n=1 Tax=unclassified Microbacterium TaxID=2609290 RepID=UPI003017805E